jgi:uncharacterized protein (TIGR02594 family)
MASQSDLIAGALRAIAPEGKLKANEVPLINQIAALWEKRITLAQPVELPWIRIGRALVGTKEIPGPQHNSWIAKGWARLGATWLNTDESPWCGFFVAHCLDAVSLSYPKGGMFARALSWATYGVACSPRVGAIGVKKRAGGGHVFFIVGITPDGQFYKALEGNANNMVRIGDVRVSDVIAVRWPVGIEVVNLGLPVHPKGEIASTEA